MKIPHTDSLILLAVSASTVISLSAASSPESETVLKIHDQVIGSISPKVFGQFLERPSWGGETGPEAVVDADGKLPPKVMEMLADLRPPVVRFPGGSDVDRMNWTDLIGHSPDRHDPQRPVSLGQRGDEVTNRFGYDEFFHLREILGFDVVLVGNLRQALYKKRPMEEAALHEAGLLAYARARPGAKLPDGMPDWGGIRAQNGRPEPVPVRYFMVGNEAQFFWPPKKAEELAELGLADTQEAWEWFRECLITYGKALKAVDPEIELILDGFHDPFNPANNEANTARKAIYLHPEVRALYGHLGAHHYAPMGFHGARLEGKPAQATDLSDAQIWYGLVSAPGLHDHTGQNVAVGAQLTPWWPAVDELSLLDVLVTRTGPDLFLHAINRSPDEDLPLRIELPPGYRLLSSQQSVLTSDPMEPFERQDTLPLQIKQHPISDGNLAVVLPRHALTILEIKGAPNANTQESEFRSQNSFRRSPI